MEVMCLARASIPVVWSLSVLSSFTVAIMAGVFSTVSSSVLVDFLMVAISVPKTTYKKFNLKKVEGI